VPFATLRRLRGAADQQMESEAAVVAVMATARHIFSKQQRNEVRLIAGIGVEGDAHAGATDQHLYTKKRDPNRPNVRQVHLMHAELFASLEERGIAVAPGELGENITTRGIDLLGLSEGTLLRLGEAQIRITGLRNPCFQIDKFRPGLMREMIVDAKAKTFLCGVMSVVTQSGIVRPGDPIFVVPPAGEFRRLVPV
jgi:MOSC domain-containing protein YiiM